MLTRFSALVLLGILSGCVSPEDSLEQRKPVSLKSGKNLLTTQSPYDFSTLIQSTPAKQTIEGYFTIPEGSGKFPAVVILHNSGGYKAHTQSRYVKMLNEMGIATFSLDSFGPRHVKNTVPDESVVTEQMMLADAYAALSLLRNDPRIIPDKIGILGFSKGAIASFYAAMDPIGEWYGIQPGKGFTSHAGFYPFCGIQLEEGRMNGAPVLLMLGEKDDYTPAHLCTDLVEKLDLKSDAVDVRIYADSYHLFDRSSSVKHSDRYLNPSKCSFLISDDAKTIEVNSGKHLKNYESRVDALSKCVTKGGTFGGNPEARTQSLEDLKAFFKQTLLDE